MSRNLVTSIAIYLSLLAQRTTSLALRDAEKPQTVLGRHEWSSSSDMHGGVQVAPRAEKLVRTVPDFALTFAPLVYLHEDETYFPADIGAQLANTIPDVNHTPIASPPAPSPLSLSNLSGLNAAAVDATGGGTNVFLTAKGDFTTNPAWLAGVKPDAQGVTNGAVSAAVIVRDWGDVAGTCDVYYMYFYAYNRGDVVLGQELGDHIGDWEHNMVRFINGKPQYVWYSEHDFGEAFTYAAVPKSGSRVVSYSAQGTHANWATVGSHDHTIPGLSDPFGLIKDYTSAGALWDPVRSAYFYSVSFNSSGPSFEPLPNPYTNAIPPVDWLYFNGQWGDAQLPASDHRQVNFLHLGKFWKFTDGPNGPRFKDLNRTLVCLGTQYPCIVRTVITPGD